MWVVSRSSLWRTWLGTKIEAQLLEVTEEKQLGMKERKSTVSWKEFWELDLRSCWADVMPLLKRAAAPASMDGSNAHPARVNPSFRKLL